MELRDKVFNRQSENETMKLADMVGYGEDWVDDPVFEKDSNWYFWDETWHDHYGPYHSEKEARKELKRYCVYVLGEKEELDEGIIR